MPDDAVPTGIYESTMTRDLVARTLAGLAPAYRVAMVNALLAQIDDDVVEPARSI